MDHQPAGDAAFYDDLAGARMEAWRRLARGVADRRSGFRTVQLATVAPDGAPRVRTVVLRGVDATARRLRAHTDARSPKIDQLTADPRAEICAYDAGAKIQIRARGRIAIHGADSVAQDAWDGSAPGSRLCYRAAHAPGAPLSAPQDGDPTEAMRQADAEAGRDQFRALMLQVVEMEWLYLAARGHRRALFVWTGRAWSDRWLQT
jgi:hypothetical protein